MSTTGANNASIVSLTRRSTTGRGLLRQFASVAFDQEEDDQPKVTVEFHDDNDGSITLIEVPQGTKITEAADMAGVYIVSIRQLD